MKSYTNILFDLDGTLVDSAEGILGSMRYAFDQEGIKVNHLDFSALIGPPLAQGLRQFLPDVFREDHYLDHVVKLVRAHYAEHGVHQGELYPGIDVLLQNLKSSNKRLFVATSKPQVFAAKILSTLNVADHFDHIAGNVLTGNAHTKGEIISHVLAKLPQGLDEHAIMIGDRYHDIEGARENGIDSIGVRYGYGTAVELEQYQPTFLASDAKELEKILAGLI